MPAKYTPEQRVSAFWSKVDRNGPVPDYAPHLGPCWLWTGARNSTGYALVGDGQGHVVCSHRVSYEMHVGPIPDGLEVDHLCRVKNCVNPHHLEAVTPLVNTRRGSQYASRETCEYGHLFSPENTYTRADGARRCRACKRRRDSARREAGR